MIEMRLKEYREYAEKLGVKVSDAIVRIPDVFYNVRICSHDYEPDVKGVDLSTANEIAEALIHMLRALKEGDEMVYLFDEGYYDERVYVIYLADSTNGRNTDFGELAFTSNINLNYNSIVLADGCEVIRDEFELYSDFDPVCKFIANILEKMAHELYKNRISHIDWDRLNPIKDALIDINRQIQEAREYYESPEGEMEWNRHVALDLDLDNPLDVLNQLSLRDFSYSDERGLYVDDERRANYDYVGIDLSCLEKPQEKTKGR